MRSEFPVLITDVTSGSKLEATLIVELTLDEIDEAVGLWTPYLQGQMMASHRIPQHAHWNWSKLARNVKGLRSYAFLGVRAGDEIQAIMLWEDSFSKARHSSQLGKDLVYIPFISTAPWNDIHLVAEPKYRGAGSLLMSKAIEHSIELEYKGRLGLHSLPQAEAFYRDACQMIDLGLDQAHEDLRYFEFTPELAENFLIKTGGKP
jgi:GNAT superfamily N-acetyltransferase